MPKTISIVHLSDLHLSTTEYGNQSIVLRALWDDLRERRRGGQSFDLVFFTGDLIAKGQYTPENEALARDSFFQPLLQATGIPADRLFVVPGNHDIQLSKRSKYLGPVHDTLDSQDKVRDYLLQSQTDPLRTGLEAFRELTKPLSTSPPLITNSLYTAYRVTIGSVDIGICAINSAWRATGRANNADCGTLIIGRHQMDEVLNAVRGCEKVFGLFHHPLNWLAPFDNGVIHRLLALHFDGIFFGHNHETDSTSIAGSAGNYFASNAACLYQNRDYSNGYSIITYDANQSEWQVHAREYFETRQSFDDATRFAPNGRQTFSVSRRGNSTATLFPTPEFISAVNETVDGYLMSSTVSKVAPTSLRAIFVDPPLSHVSQRQMSSERQGSDRPLYVTLKDILYSKAATFFVGAKESGKTTLLHRICCMSGDVNLIAFPPFAVCVDMSNSPHTRAQLLEAIVTFSGSTYRRSEFIEFLGQGLVAVCFDNFDIDDPAQGKLLAAFTAEFPACRYFFSVREDMEASLTSSVIPNLNLNSQVIYIHAFGRRETRALAKRWFGELDALETDKVDEILSLLGRLNIPRTPFLISALLWIKESSLEFLAVNRAAILDAFIDGVLEKLSESKARSDVDSTIKRHFLAALSEHLAELNVRRITVSELDQFTVSYFQKRDLNISSGPFISELNARGIFSEVGGYVGFKFNCVRAFFLAVRLRESESLLKQALSYDSFLKFTEEIDYFTGSTRDRVEVLRDGIDLLTRLHREAGLELDIGYFDDVSLESSPFAEHKRAELTEKLLGSRLRGEKREQLLDRIDGTSVKTAQSPEETVIVQPTDPVRRFMTGLQIVSTILRNSELVEDADMKRSAYDLITTYWCEILIGVLIAVDFLEDDPREREAINSFLPLNNKKLAMYFLKVIAPTVVINIALESLGTAKLQLTMEHTIKENKYTAKQVFSTFHYVDLGLPNRFTFLSNLLSAHRGSRFVSELIFFKVVQVFAFGKMSDREEDEIKDLLNKSVDIIISAKSQVERSRLKNRVLEDLKKRRLAQGGQQVPSSGSA
jgi:hypothetical protein